ALVFQPHVRRPWRGWLVVGVLAIANALAPYNHPYLIDILSSAGAIRSALAPFILNIFAAAADYSVYAAAFMVACWMWWTGRAPYQFPLSIGFLFVLALFLLSQNTQATGLPSALVIVFMLYDQLCRQFAGSRSRDVTPLLLTLMIFPAISVAVSAM